MVNGEIQRFTWLSIATVFRRDRRRRNTIVYGQKTLVYGPHLLCISSYTIIFLRVYGSDIYDRNNGSCKTPKYDRTLKNTGTEELLHFDSKSSA
jgi:hypothetical protein